MALELATAYVSLSVSAKGVRGEVDRELRKSTAGADKAGKQAGSRFKSGMSGALKGFGAGLLAGVATDKVVGFFKDAQRGASDLEQSVGGVQAVFKGFAPQIEKSSKDAAQSLGLTRNEYNELATVLGAGLKNKGFKDFGKQTQDLIGIGADLSAQFGGSTQEAVDALASAMRGEMDPIEKYGISLNEAALKAEAMKLGLSDGKGTLTESAKAQASLSLITKQSADAQGAFGREADTAAGKQARLRATWENMRTTLGEKLLPVVSRITGAANNFLVEMQKGEGAGGKFRDVMVGIKDALVTGYNFIVRYKDQIVALGLIVGTATVAIKAYQVATKLAALWTGRQAIAQGLLNAAMALNPIGLIVAGLVALGVGLVLAYKKSETFRRIVDGAWSAVKGAAKATVDWWTGTAWPAIKSFFTKIGNGMTSAKDAIAGAWDSIKRKISGIKDWITDVAWPGLKNTLSKLAGYIPVVAIWRNWDKIKGYFTSAWNWVKGTFKKWWGGVKAIVTDPIGSAKTIVTRFLGATGLRKPFTSVWNWVKKTFDTWWTGVKLIFTDPIGSAKTVITRLLGATGLRRPLTNVWNWVKSTFDRWWSGIKRIFTDPVGAARDTIRRILGATGLQKIFKSARDAIGRIWSGLDDKIKKPIRSALSWVNDKLIGKINGLLSTKILSIPKSWRIPEIPGFASGGWTGPGSKYQPAGVVHADEFVVNKKARNRFERDNPGTLDHINRFGRLPGYAIGGKVGGLNKRFREQLAAFNAAAGNRYSVYSGYRSNAHQAQLYQRYLAGRGPVAAPPGGSQHNKGLAADLAPSNARDVHGALAKQFGLVFTVPSESWHIEPSWGRSGGGGGGFGFGLPSWLSNPLKWVKDKLAGTMSSLTSRTDFGLAGPILPGVANKLRDAAVDKVKKAADSLLDFGGGPTADVGGVVNSVGAMATKAAVKNVARQYGWASGRQWDAIDWIVSRESSWNPRAANPSSSARGLFQKMTNIHGPVEATAEGQARWGLNYIRTRYGTPLGAKAFWQRNNWYADGGRVKPAVFDNGGTLAPGLNLVDNKLGKPESLVRPEQMRPSVNISFAPGTEWLADFVRTEISYSDDFKGAHARMGVG